MHFAFLGILYYGVIQLRRSRCRALAGRLEACLDALVRAAGALVP